MNKIKMNFDEIEKSFLVINEEENGRIKGGDWAQDFYNSHSQGVYSGGYVAAWYQDNGYGDSPWGNYGGYGGTSQPFNLNTVVISGVSNQGGVDIYSYSTLFQMQQEFGDTYGTLEWYDTDDYASGGGEYEPPQKDLMGLLQNDIATLFPTEVSSNLIAISSKTDLPPGYTLASDGSYLDANGNKSFAVAYKSGDLTFIYISPHEMEKDDVNSRAYTIGHELMHAQHYEENAAMYNSTDPAVNAQFHLDTELAAYSWEYNRALSLGNTDMADKCLNQINSFISQGATGGFSTSFNP